MDRLLTIQEIGRQLNIPESTLRYWRDRYEEYIPSVGEGRKKRYKQEAVLVFQRIAELSAEKLTAEDIAERLSLEFSSELTIRDTNSQNVATTLDLYAFQRILENLVINQAKMNEILQENFNLKSQIQEINNRMDQQEKLAQERDAKLMETIRELQQRKEKKWWRFWK